MKVFDISQEVFSGKIFPGDPVPRKIPLNRMEEGSLYNLSSFQMCAHNGTHIDAPFHFLNDGNTIDKVSLDVLVGPAYVAFHEGIIGAADIQDIFYRAYLAGDGCHNRILIKGNAELSSEAARFLAEKGILLFGNESQTVGNEDAPMEVHLILLNSGIILLEGIRLTEIPEGKYLLHAAPINLGGFDGAPCRAVLMDLYSDKCAEKVVIMNMCMICDGDNVVALDKVSGNYHGTTFPGGHVEKGETFSEAMIREVKEETGLTIKGPVLRGIYHWYKEGVHQIGLMYRATEYSGTLQSSDEGKVYWISRPEYEKKDLAVGMPRVLRMMDDDNITECFMDVHADGTITEHLF